MITLTFPDGAQRQYEPGITGRAVAEGIAKSLAKRTVAMALDGRVADLSDPILRDARIEFLTREDPRALELIRHDAAHVLAEAVQSLYPGTQVTIGPVIENGFYYDFARTEPFTPEDFPAIEAKMREIIAQDRPFTKEVWSRDKAQQVFRDKGELFKLELIDAIPEGRGPQDLRPGRVVRPLPRAAHDLDRQDRQRLQADEGRRRLLARRFQQPDADPDLRHGLGYRRTSSTHYLKQLEEAEKRDHRRLGREMDLFHFQEEGPGVVFWHPKGWTLFQELIAYMRRRLKADYQEVNAPQILDKSLWETSGHWGWYRENMFVTQDRGRARLRDQADELPRACADLQVRLEVVPRSAAAACRIRRRLSLRAVRRPAWAAARSRLHAGRRARLLHRGPARRRVPRRSTI